MTAIGVGVILGHPPVASLFAESIFRPSLIGRAGLMTEISSPVLSMAGRYLTDSLSMVMSNTSVREAARRILYPDQAVEEVSDGDHGDRVPDLV